jgi:lipoyl(octanoyl) transferase
MDLSPFQSINPCGYPDLETVDMSSLGVQADQAEVANRLVQELQAQLV